MSHVDNQTFDRNISEPYYDLLDITRIVHMPGDITQTNGEIREDQQSVEWTLHEHGDLETFAVMSERPADAEGTGDSPWLPLAVVIISMRGVLLALTV